jgi:hypothetical protein
MAFVAMAYGRPVEGERATVGHTTDAMAKKAGMPYRRMHGLLFGHTHFREAAGMDALGRNPKSPADLHYPFTPKRRITSRSDRTGAV